MADFSKPALDALVAQELSKPQASISQPVQETPQKGVSKWAQLATLGGHGADAASTIWALRQGGMEGNPIYGQNPSAGRILGTKAGAAALQMLMQHVVGKKSPKLANVMGFSTGGALGGLAAYNVSQGMKSRK